MKNKRGMLCITGGLLLIAAALVLTGYNMWDESRAGREADALAVLLQQEILTMQQEAETEKEPTQAVGTREPEGEELVTQLQDTQLQAPQLPVYVLNPDMEMPVKTIEDRDYIGVLEIPSLGLVLPVISDWSYPALKVAPCRYEGSVYKDSLIIAAHNYKSHFGLLEELPEGELVSFTDMDGNVFHYEVAFTEILMPTAIEEMTGGEWDLTLFTCTLGGQYRVTVRCDRVE